MARIPDKTVSWFRNPPTIVQRSGISIGKKLKDFILDKGQEKKAAVYGLIVMRFLDWCENQGVLCLSDVTSETVGNYCDGIDRRFSLAYFNLHVSVLRSFFNWLIRVKCLKANPASAILRRKNNGFAGGHSMSDVAQLLDTTDCASFEDLRDRAIVAVVIFAFGNTAAIGVLNREDYHYSDDTYWLRFNAKNSRLEIPVNAQLERYLQEYVAVRDSLFQSYQPLFLGTRGYGFRQRISHRSLQRAVKRWSQRAGIKDGVLIRLLRAGGLRQYLDSGGSLEKACVLARHKNISTTARYAESLDPVVIYEGDLDGLLACVDDSTSSPLLEHFRRKGTFRLSVIIDKKKPEQNGSSES